ncbi:MAG TPA: PDZ domain-containing protein [Candidatus Bathyarchaeia archaeon]|nr:PDZ domain-containing protein [Candidatus Bathyarchaeia archaeon]
MAETENIQGGKGKSRTAKFVFFVVLVFVVSGIGSVLSEKYVFPWLATRPWFEKQAIFKRAMDNVTVINKTEQVTVNENQDISSYTQKSASAVVEIVSKQPEDKILASATDQSESGVIVTSDGLVASYGDKFYGGKDTDYQVFSQDGKSYSATVAAKDPFSNIVLLKLDNAQNLPVAEFIAPEDIKPGMKTAVIGRSGFNSEISLRLGITTEWAKSYSVSGSIASSEKLQGVLFADLLGLQDTDSMVLTGSAAVDQNGNMLGILGEKKEDSGGKFFIVPINHLQYVIDQYLGKGKIERATLGVYYSGLSKEAAYLAGNNFDRGALVYSPSGQQGLAVIAGSPADQAGIKMGDIILSVNSDEVNPDQNLAYLISKYKPGDTVSLKINRDGKDIDVKVVLQ